MSEKNKKNKNNEVNNFTLHSEFHGSAQNAVLQILQADDCVGKKGTQVFVLFLLFFFQILQEIHADCIMKSHRLNKAGHESDLFEVTNLLPLCKISKRDIFSGL